MNPIATFAPLSLLLVALGGAAGAVLRYVTIEGVNRLHPAPFPFSTLLVNVLGSLAIGMLMAKFMLHDAPAARLLLVTGLLGGFTTFSAFSWDMMQLMQRGEILQAVLYGLGSVGLSLAAVIAGVALAR